MRTAILPTVKHTFEERASPNELVMEGSVLRLARNNNAVNQIRMNESSNDSLVHSTPHTLRLPLHRQGQCVLDHQYSNTVQSTVVLHCSTTIAPAVSPFGSSKPPGLGSWQNSYHVKRPRSVLVLLHLYYSHDGLCAPSPVEIENWLLPCGYPVRRSSRIRI
jgi:hypothetical protein